MWVQMIIHVYDRLMGFIIIMGGDASPPPPQEVDVQFKPTTTQGFHLTPYLSQFEKATSYAGFRKFSAGGGG